jgi:hypothetical protein
LFLLLLPAGSVRPAWSKVICPTALMPAMRTLYIKLSMGACDEAPIPFGSLAVPITPRIVAWPVRRGLVSNARRTVRGGVSTPHEQSRKRPLSRSVPKGAQPYVSKRGEPQAKLIGQHDGGRGNQDRSHQMRTRSCGSRWSLSPGFTPKASYQASILRIEPSTRKRADEWRCRSTSAAFQAGICRAKLAPSQEIPAGRR